MRVKLSRLLYEVRPDYIEYLIMSGLIGTISDRGFGKTTAHAFGIISQAMLRPKDKIKIVETGFHVQDRYLADCISSIIQKLELKCFHLSRTHMTLTYDPYIELEISVREV